MANIFDSVKMSKPKSNVFDLSHDVKLSLNMGELVPIMCMECVPSDRVNISAESLLRFAPLISPVMHRMDVTMHYFFVPNRLIWAQWENFITNTKVGGTLPAFPFIQYGEPTLNKRLGDYLGLPNAIAGQFENISALPFAAYQMIYNEYYRDQNLVPETAYQLINGDNGALINELTPLRNRSWEHDYFTSALPFAQKGDPVLVPLQGDVTVRDDAGAPSNFPQFKNSIGANDFGTGAIHINPLTGQAMDEAGTGQPQILDPKGTLEVINAETTINDLRKAFRLQEWLEKNARGGTRYIENILAHFGTKSSDKRLQRPEYITGTKSPVIISEILNTTGTAELPQGNMAGHAISVTNGKKGTYHCEEHGYIIGIMSVMPRTAYQQGIPKHFLKNLSTEFYWPSFANIGEQEIQNREIYAFQGATGSETFGYTPRYAEYKFINNTVAGEFKTTLDFWHMGRIFANPPALNSTFITSNPSDRIFAVVDPTAEKLYAHVFNKIKAVRPMPKYGTPTF